MTVQYTCFYATGTFPCRSKDEHISNVFLWTPANGYTRIGPAAESYIHQLSADSGCRRDDLPRAIAYRDGRQDRVKGIHAVGSP